MYKEALKTVVYLQQIIEDNYGDKLGKNGKYQKVEMKDIYGTLYPYENLNKIMKPSLQAEVRMYRDREEEFRMGLRKGIKELEE